MAPTPHEELYGKEYGTTCSFMTPGTEKGALVKRPHL